MHITANNDADRNLPLGILAVQVDFVSHDALLRATNARVRAKHRPLAELLQEHGSLFCGSTGQGTGRNSNW
jgi:hypothetical protein